MSTDVFACWPVWTHDRDAHIHEVAGTSGIGPTVDQRERHDATLQALVWLGAIVGGGVFWYGLLVLAVAAWKALFG